MKPIIYAMPILVIAAAAYYFLGVKSNVAAGAKSVGAIELIASEAQGSPDGRAMCLVNVYGLAGASSDGAFVDVSLSAADPSTGLMQVSYVRKPLSQTSSPIDCRVVFSDSGAAYAAHVFWGPIAGSNQPVPLHVVFDE